MTSPSVPTVGAVTPLFAVRGGLLLGGDLARGAIVVRDGRIADIRRGIDVGSLPLPVFEADVVSPGLIDLQVNGAYGFEIGEDPLAYRELAARLPSSGVTAFVPTLVSAAKSDYKRALEAFERGAPGVPGAVALGLHLEGPLLSLKRAGAHVPGAIESAGLDVYDDVLDSGHVRIVTVAPERPGVLPLIERLCRQDIVVSLGHTDATHEEFVQGIDRGATLVTHLFSAMSPFHHRAPGAAGAALLDPRVTVGIMSDGVHCAMPAIELALRAKSWERIALVTDVVAPAGTPPGHFEFADGRRIVFDEHRASLPDGTLAGSVLFMDRGVRNVVHATSATLAEALRMASEIPARVLRLPGKGKLVVGADADLVLWGPDLRVQATFVGGRAVFSETRTSATAPGQ